MKRRLLGTLVALCLSAAAFAPTGAYAAQWYWNQSVTQINSYPSSTLKFVWFSDNATVRQYCDNTVHFDEGGAGGITTTTILTAAFLHGKRVDVQIGDDGCTIVEVYLHN